MKSITDLKIYENKNIGKFQSLPSKVCLENVIDSIYLAANFEKLRIKPVSDVRASKHYLSTVRAWNKKLADVNLSDLGIVARKLGCNLKVFDPLSKPRSLSSKTITSPVLFSGGKKTKRNAHLLKVGGGKFKPMEFTDFQLDNVSEGDELDLEEDLGLHGEEEHVNIETLSKNLENAVAANQMSSSKFAVIDSTKHAEPIASVLLQVDKTPRNRLTIQQIMVKGSFRRQGVAKRILNELKKACVRTGRVAHVQSATGDGMDELLTSNGFSTVESTPFDYVWKWNANEPLSWDNWYVDLSWAGNESVFTEEEVSRVDHGMVNFVKTMAGFTKFYGMEVFHENAKWYKAETDLGIIAERLGRLSEFSLSRYRKAKQCFNQSYLYSISDERCFTIHGWGVDIETKFPTAHTCLCAVLDDGLFIFDLVRDTPLFIYGVPVRRDFMEKIEDIGSHGGLYAIDTMNFLRNERTRHGHEDMNELLKTLREKQEMKSKKYDSPSESYSSDEEEFSGEDESGSDQESSTDTDEEDENDYSNRRRTRRRTGGKQSVVNDDVENSDYINEALAKSIQVCFSKMRDPTTKANTILSMNKYLELEGGAGASGTSKSMVVPRQMSRYTTPQVSKNVVKPMQSLRSKAYPPQQGSVFKDVFHSKSIDGDSTVDVNDEINKIIGNQSKITSDMVVAYLTIGTEPCDEGIIVESHETYSEPSIELRSQEGTGVLSFNCLSNSHSFCKGSVTWINLKELKKNKEIILKDIEENYDHVRRLSTEPVFHEVFKAKMTNEEVFDGSLEEEIVSEGSPQYAGGILGRMGKGLVMPIQPRRTQKDLMKELLSRTGESPSKGGQRHVLKLTYTNNERVSSVVLKVALDIENDEAFQMEADIYSIFKKSYASFYSTGVVQFYGSGKVQKHGNVRFTDAFQETISFSINDRSASSYDYTGRTYMILDYNPSYTTAGNLLKRHQNDQDYEDLSKSVLVETLSLHRRANEIASFSHGDLHYDNVLVFNIGKDMVKAKLFDFDNSSIAIDGSKGDMIFNDILTMTTGYNNHYIKLFVKEPEKLITYERKYLWYMDCIRYVVSLRWQNFIREDIYKLLISRDLEIAFVIESIIDMIPRKSGSRWLNSWYKKVWNGALQSHEFVSAVISSAERKLGLVGDDYQPRWVM